MREVAGVLGGLPQAQKKPDRFDGIVGNLSARPVEIIDGFTRGMLLKANVVDQKIVPAQSACKE